MILKILKLLAVNIVILLLIFIFVEGLSSGVLFFRGLVQNQVIVGKQHAEHDDQLGWVNTPDTYIEDMYGPGVYVRTNSQAFRNNKEFSFDIESGMVRILCLGDSFTFGYGVDNDNNWCNLLTAVDDRLETVNMGQNGYGIDQIYLLYKREASKLKHNVVLFSFITDDFARMRQQRFLGNEKPLVGFKANELVLNNVPVPKSSFFKKFFWHNRILISKLNSLKLYRSLFSKNNPDKKLRVERGGKENSLDIIVFNIIQELKRIAESNNSRLVLVHLPKKSEYVTHGSRPVRWRSLISNYARETDIPYIDLLEDFRKMSFAEVEESFITETEFEYSGTAGHYSVKGNRYVADLLYRRLVSMPELSGDLPAKKQR